AGGDVTARDRLVALQERLRVAQGLEPTRIRLALKDAPVADTLPELSRQARLPLTLTGPTEARLSLNLDGAPFWEALDRLRDQGGLRWTVTRDRHSLRLRPAKRLPARAVYPGPCRLALLGVSRQRTISFLTGQERESLSVGLGVALEPSCG